MHSLVEKKIKGGVYKFENANNKETSYESPQG